MINIFVEKLEQKRNCIVDFLKDWMDRCIVDLLTDKAAVLSFIAGYSSFFLLLLM